MKKLGTYLLVLLLSGCASVPISYRNQLNLVPEYKLIASSEAAYHQYLSESNVLGAQHPQTVMLRKVGDKLVTASIAFLKDNGQYERMAGFNWEFNLVENDSENAWCLPGGKVVVFTNLLPITSSEEGLAVVLSHEISHALSHHASERMSQQLLAELGGDVLVNILSGLSNNGLDLGELIETVLDYGTQVTLLKYSRNHELEADKMGMVIMEYAGYDGEQAIVFWKRMKQYEHMHTPTFLNTHPTNDQRLSEMQAFLPVAKSYIKN